jgi:riboflavin synthase
MFTGIVETMARVVAIRKISGNIDLTFSSPITQQLKIDQSVSHNGVCLTVVEINEENYRVTAIDETLKRTNLGSLKEGDHVNLERCMPVNGRFDGHIVQGHVDTTAECISVNDLNGSWEFRFRHERAAGNLTVEKGSVTVNGVSLTVVDSTAETFSVHIIPYTFENTNFRELKAGMTANIEFDIIGKYVARLINNKNVR